MRDNWLAGSQRTASGMFKLDYMENPQWPFEGLDSLLHHSFPGLNKFLEIQGNTSRSLAQARRILAISAHLSPFTDVILLKGYDKAGGLSLKDTLTRSAAVTIDM